MKNNDAYNFLDGEECIKNEHGVFMYSSGPHRINLKCLLEDFAELQTEPLIKILEEARLQIEYLHNKFKPTGSGNSLLSRIETAIQSAT